MQGGAVDGCSAYFCLTISLSFLRKNTKSVMNLICWQKVSTQHTFLFSGKILNCPREETNNYYVKMLC